MMAESITHSGNFIPISYFGKSDSLFTTSLVNLEKDLTNTDRVYPFKKSEMLVCSTI